MFDLVYPEVDFVWCVQHDSVRNWK